MLLAFVLLVFLREDINTLAKGNRIHNLDPRMNFRNRNQKHNNTQVSTRDPVYHSKPAQLKLKVAGNFLLRALGALPTPFRSRLAESRVDTLHTRWYFEVIAARYCKMLQACFTVRFNCRHLSVWKVLFSPCHSVSLLHPRWRGFVLSVEMCQASQLWHAGSTVNRRRASSMWLTSASCPGSRLANGWGDFCAGGFLCESHRQT